MKRIGVLCLAKYPGPSVKGGAVETLVTNLLDENEKSHLLDLVVFSFGDKEAESQSETYKNAEFFFIKKSKGTCNSAIDTYKKIFHYILPSYSNNKYNINFKNLKLFLYIFHIIM